MLARPTDEAAVARALERSPVVLLTGPRQAGKSTLARQVAGAFEQSVVFDLENPADARRMDEPMLALHDRRGLVVIDEAQHTTDLFPVLRVLADRPDRPATFLILGSASPELVGLSSESLAGRVALLELGGFRFTDVPADDLNRLWIQGALPRAFVADPAESVAWREDYIATFLERDLGQLGVRVPATQMRRFWTMLAHYHGQTWNGSEVARALGVSQPTTRRYLDALTDALLIRQLQPWYENVGKRVVRSPKIYLRDSGLLHTLLGLETLDDVLGHPKVGASWEGFVVEEIARIVHPRPIYFWATQSGAEIDVFLEHRGRRIGIEIKRADAPRITPSIRNAIQDLRLNHVLVITPGTDRYALSDQVTVVPPTDLAAELA